METVSIENHIKKDEEIFRIVAEYTYAWEYWIGTDHRFRYVSPSCERITGYKPYEFLEKPSLLEEIIHPEDKARFLSHDEFSFGTKLVDSIYFRIIAKNGDIKWIGHICYLIHSPEGKFLGKRASNMDITDQRKAEIALKANEEKYRTIFESTGTMMIMVNNAGGIALANKEFTGFCGISENEIGDSDNFFNYIVEEEKKRVKSFHKKRGEKDPSVPRTYESRLKNSSGDVIDVLVNVEIIPGSGLRIISMQDISWRKMLEKQVLTISYEEQKRIGIDLHDGLSQKLTGAALLSKQLEKRLGEKSPHESRIASDIVKLINESIEQTRLMVGGLTLASIKKNNLNALLIEYSADIEKVFDISCVIDYNLDYNITDNAIVVQLFYIVKEAVNNAIKHSGAKNVIISINSHNDEIILAIEDDGCGISKNYNDSKGIGIKIMHYRANIINGILEIKNNTPAGTCVACKFSRDI